MKKKRNPARVAKSTAGQRRYEGTPLRRQRTRMAAEDVSRGLKDTERRGVPNDLPQGASDLPKGASALPKGRSS